VKRIAVFPTLLTLGNAFCGFLSISYVADAVNRSDPGEAARFMVHAAWMIFLAMAFDAFDGKVARVTGKASHFGAELDSLADVISFGVAPAYLVKVLVQIKAPTFFNFHPRFAMLVSVLFVLCAALRLARYNVEARSERSDKPKATFQGLPSPAAAGALASVVLVFFELANPDQRSEVLGLEPETRASIAQVLVRVLPFTMPVFGYLMISKIPYTHMVNRYASGRRPLTYLAQVLILLVATVSQPELTLAAAFVGYAVISPLLRLRSFTRRRRGEAPVAKGPPCPSPTPPSGRT
jgi:CDP-diacylglycerol--serine O-phosphatidyltransferase